jgi:hypothetical protein
LYQDEGDNTQTQHAVQVFFLSFFSSDANHKAMSDEKQNKQPTQAELRAKKRAANMRANLLRRKKQKQKRDTDPTS